MVSHQKPTIRHTVLLQTVLVLITLCGLPPLQASSVLNFPRLSFESGTLTGLAIVNPNGQSADVILTAYNADGSLLAGVNQVQRTIEADSQLAELVSGLFSGDPDTVGWIQATTSTDNLTGFFLVFNDTLPFNLFDGADLPEAAPELVFTQVRIDSGYTTELNLINLGSTTTNLQLDLISSGASVATQLLSLPEKGAIRRDVADLFQTSQVSSDVYVTVTSDGDIAGFELVRSANGDLVGLNARSRSEQLTHLYFPQMLELGGVQTSVGVVNNSDQAVILTFTAFKKDGTLFGTEDLKNNAVTEALNPGAILVRDLKTLFGFSGSEIRDGWLQVESSSPAVTGYLTYELPDSGAAATVTPNQAGQTRGIFSHIATIEGLFTGVAVLNPGQLVANVRIVAVKKDGTVLGSTSVLLQPGQRISELLGEDPPGLIPEAAGQGDGYVFISSDLPVYLTSLFGDLNVFSNIPPQQSPEGFDPAAGIPILEINPSLAIVQPSGLKAFQVEGVMGSAVWSVNGDPGGNSTVGTIDDQGNYTAPAQVPEESPTVTVSATVDNQTAGASLDILDKQALFSSVSIVQSVVYLGSLQNLYTAELTILSGSGSGAEPAQTDPAQDVVDSEIFTVPAGLVKSTLANFPNEEIAKMISFEASNEEEFLLLAAKTTGRVLRLDPTNGATKEIATGLNEPSALVIDAVSGNLLVAEKTQVTSIPKADLEMDLSAAVLTLPDTGREALAKELFPTDAADGIAVNRCTGDIFFSKREQGVLVRFRRPTGVFQTLFSDLEGPTQLLAIYRRGVSCPNAFQLLVIEQETDRLLLLRPEQGSTVSFIPARGSTDITFLPRGTPFLASREGILLTEAADPNRVTPDTISTAPVPETYRDDPSTLWSSSHSGSARFLHCLAAL